MLLFACIWCSQWWKDLWSISGSTTALVLIFMNHHGGLLFPFFFFFFFFYSIRSHFCASHSFVQKHGVWDGQIGTCFLFLSWNKSKLLQTSGICVEAICLKSRFMGQRSGLRTQNLAALHCAVCEKIFFFLTDSCPEWIFCLFRFFLVLFNRSLSWIFLKSFFFSSQGWTFLGK